jgi:hypothetical protein
VVCGSNWSFDLPTAISCCTNEFSFSGVLTNVLITSTGITTNGSCPQYITQTWLITDGCGDSNTCSQTVTVVGCCSNNPCCGPGLGAQTIQWLQLPLTGTVLSDPTGANPAGTWIVTNLPCYGRVLVTQNCPDLVYWFLNPNMANVPGAYGSFDNVETGYGPYSWGTGSWLDLYAYSNIAYTVNFYFLDGQPNPCSVVLGVAGLAESTTATVSQPVTFRGEYDLAANAPGGNGNASAHTALDYAIPSPSGSTGTTVGSAYGPPVNDNYGDPLNTGWALLQPTNDLQTASLPTGSGTGWPGPMAGVPYLSLAVNQQAGDGIGFTVGYICCTNCLQVVCAPDKTVPCGSAWTFDLPAASSCCTNQFTTTGVLTNLLITSTGIATNGACPQLITQTWLITDACGNSNTCSQTVTVVNTNPPVLHCASNKTVPCGTAWSFDAPTATDACCTNLTITVIGTVTNVVTTNSTSAPCGVNYTRTWEVTDCCTNTATCSQTVTVVNDLPPIVNVLCVTNVYFAGGGNGFTAAVSSSPSAGLRARFAGDPFKQFDQCLINSVFIDTISHLPPCITAAYLTMALKPCGDIPDNDAINLAFTGPNGILEIGSDSWSSFIGSGNSSPGLPGIGVWGSSTSEQVITIDLGNLPPGSGGPTSLLSDLNRYGFLDFELEDDSGVDYLQLTVVTCCCSTNKTVPCGTPWVFNVPTAVDACSGASVPATILSTVTNGQCPQVITRTWLFTDVCGNTNTCSQTVTVVNTNPPALACPSNKTVQCGTLWSFDAPTATDACCTNVAITVLGTVVSQSNSCTTVYTRTWEATDCCTNRATCSQTVTVVDTTPPVILDCPYPTVTVPLRPCNQILIPVIKLVATDNCTPASQLRWSQSPPANTIVSGPSASVTVTVTDLCGNSSHCVVQVVGLGTQTGGLVVTCPASMTVTNCLVPLVPVTATDPCCTIPPVITQWPPANTSCPGSVITVTVTDCGSTVTRSVALHFSGPESFLGNLYNTGNYNPADQASNLLVDDAVDPHYALPSNEVPAGTGMGCPGSPVPADYFGNAVAVSDKCWSLGNYCAYLNSFACYEYVPWTLLPNPVHTPTAMSKWIGPDYTNNGCCPGGVYTYTLNFQMPVAVTPASATIQGRFAADNMAGIYLNGLPVPASDGGVTHGGIFNDAGFAQWTSFTIPPNSGFGPGNNTLTFMVTNTDSCSWTALRVEFTNAIANCCTCAPPVMQPLVTESLPVGSTATFTVNNPGGTPPYSFQWYKNNVALFATPPHLVITAGSGVTTLQIKPIAASDAGLYSVIISNNCGAVTDYFRLNVTQPPPYTNAWWNVAVITSPLTATIGPDLVLTGPSRMTNYTITAGTTEDFGLPTLGDQVVNVMDINPNAGASIQIPLLAAPGTNSDPSYTVMMDLYEPDTSLGTPSTLYQSIPCCVSNLSSGGQDGLALTLDAANNLHLAGSAAGVAFDTGPTTNLEVDTWNRVALVVDDPQDGVAVNLSLYLNGQPVGSLTVPTPVGLPVNWNNGPPTLLSRQTNDVSANAEFCVASIQFAAAALAPQLIAGLGSPDNGPAPANPTSIAVATQPVLSAAVSGGMISLSWAGSPYVLQESTDLSSGVWVDSALPFTESQGKSNILTTAIAAPATTAPSKFYRLVFRP